jgi:hypothetical protein
MQLPTSRIEIIRRQAMTSPRSVLAAPAVLDKSPSLLTKENSDVPHTESQNISRLRIDLLIVLLRVTHSRTCSEPRY